MEKITALISPITHRGEKRIKVLIPNTLAAKELLKSITGRKWSQSKGCWHLPYDKASLTSLQTHFNVVKEESHKKVASVKEEVKKLKPLAAPDAEEKEIPFLRVNLPDGTVQRRVLGNKLYLRSDTDKRFKVYIPYDKAAWISYIKDIPGRAYNNEESYWSVPYVKDSFRRIWAIGKEHISIDFAIRSEIPEEYQSPLKKRKNEAPGYRKMTPMQEKALIALTEGLILEGKAARTIKTYKAMFRQFLLFTGSEVRPSQISKEQIERFLLVKRQDNASDSQMNQIINTLNAFFLRVLNQPEKLVRIKRPRKKKTLPNVFSEQEVAELLRHCENLKHKCILVLIYSAGLRKSELLNLKVLDISYERQTLFIKNGKGGKDRYTFFSETAQKYIKKYMEIYNPKYYLFEGHTRGRYGESTVQRIFENAKEKSGVNRFVTLHGLRHSFATHLVEKNVPLHHVQDLLGHNSIKTTEIYLHVSNKFRRNLRSPLDDLKIG